MAAQDHGRVSTYNNYGCRCDACKRALAIYHKNRRKNLTEEQKRRAKEQRIANLRYKERGA